MLWTDKPVSKMLLDFTVGDDYLLDSVLLPYDIQGTKAHVSALNGCGILSEAEATQATAALDELLDVHTKGLFKVLPEQEDSHTAIEEFLTKKLGEIGKKIQAGRSRNDQALTALRLYCKAQLEKAKDGVTGLLASMKKKAAENDYPMPGYTHMQKAMPYTTKKWLEAFAESLENDLLCLQSAYILVDQSPLGSAAGYGSSLQVDREAEAKLLGFSTVQQNTLFCQNSRGKFELFMLAALQQVGLTLNKLASDLMLYSTAEFGFVTKPAELCTGSSLMPQKKNPDVMELVRAKTATLSGNYMKVASVVQGLPSGYNRDLQETKKPVIDSFQIVNSSLLMMQLWVEQMAFNKEKLEAAITSELYAADKVVGQALAGVPFRDAYLSAKGGY